VENPGGMVSDLNFVNRSDGRRGSSMDC